MHNDREIIALLQKRDEAALEMIRADYGKLCRQLAYQITGSQEDAEECLGDTLLEVWHSIPPNEPDNLRAYLLSLTRRNAINRYKHERRQKRGGTQFAAALDEIAEVIPASGSVETELETMPSNRYITRKTMMNAAIIEISFGEAWDFDDSSNIPDLTFSIFYLRNN